MSTSVVIVLAFLATIGLYAMSVYNRLIDLKNKVKEGASDIDVQLKRRYDLIPNLVETVKGYAKHESGTLEAVIKARQQAIDITGLGANKSLAENALTGGLRQLFAVAENYPNLKADQNFLKLQDELTNTEDRIVASRRFYNTVVSDYNTYQTQFPAMLFKTLAAAKEEPFFEISDEKERENIKVSF